MATQFKLPQLGETVVEGTITRWLKQEGDQVEVDEPLVEVSTDKVDSEIPSPVAGTITKILAREGDTIKVGEVMAEIGGDGEVAASDATKSEEATAEAKPPEPEPQPSEPEKKEPAAERQPPPERAEPQPAAVSIESTDDEPRRGILSPLVRKMASEQGIDLAQVRGTGTGGRITKQDLMAHAEGKPAEPARPAAAVAGAPAPKVAEAEPRPAAKGEEVIAVTTMRKAIAQHMVASIQETARAWNAVEVDLTRIGKLRERAGKSFKEREGFSLTWMPFICKAVVQSLLKYPQVNSTWNGDGTITKKHYVNLGIAVALENGLIVPVIKGADGMNLTGLARAVRDLADRSRNKKLVPDDVAGGTFTITNPGPFGSVMSVPIINKGQAGILAMDAVVKRPIVITNDEGDDIIAIRQMVFLSMSWDHRIIDGSEAAIFLRDLKQLLEAADFDADLSAYIP